jgi:AraC-like DNA-binding protein
MSAEIITPVPGPRPPAGRGPERVIRPVLGALADGTPFYAPIGAVTVDGSLVTCHLCGRSLRSVAAHLPRHGWTKEQYCAAFGLERGQSLEGPATRKLRAAALTARLVFEPAVRDGSAAGRERARAGELARDAAAAAQGRAFPEQRRQKARRPLGEIRRAAAAEAIRDRADRRLARAAAEAAQRLGYPDIRSLVVARTGAGASLAAISREAGMHKDWLSRHLRQVDPVAADAARRAPHRADSALRPAVRDLGFREVAGYLRERHLVQHRTVSAMAMELGVSQHAVGSALRRHGLERVAHAAKRHQARLRAARVAAELGYPTVAAYVAQRRAAGWTWTAIAAESGQPQTWLRRQAAEQAAPPGG